MGGLARFLTMWCVFVLIAGVAHAYNSEHGPFETWQEPKRFPFGDCVDLADSKSDSDECPATWVFGLTDGGSGVRIAYGYETGLLAVLDSENGVIAGPEETGAYSLHIDVKYADLNEDKQVDFVIWTGNSSGCGLAGSMANATFILSGEDGYHFVGINTWCLDEEDFVDLKRNGKCQFIHTSFVHGEAGKDGKAHNYWVYNLMTVKGSEVVLANDLHPGFPKWIWYTKGPNHKQTRQLTEEQKERLWKEDPERIYWRPAIEDLSDLPPSGSPQHKAEKSVSAIEASSVSRDEESGEDVLPRAATGPVCESELRDWLRFIAAVFAIATTVW